MQRFYVNRPCAKLILDLTFPYRAMDLGAEGLHVHAIAVGMLCCPTWLLLTFEKSSRAYVLLTLSASRAGAHLTVPFPVPFYGQETRHGGRR